jgi:Cd2+/Zn2+-exporting ATPase
VTHPDAGDPRFHHHHLREGVIEFHRAHEGPNRRLVWKAFKIPQWRNRRPPQDDHFDYRVMLTLAGVCGIAGLGWRLAAGADLNPWMVWTLLAASYLAGSWYAAREVVRELRSGGIDVHFLMLAVAAGALFVNAAAEGATLLFLFSLSGGLEQFAHHRTQKTIGSLLNAAPKRALRRDGLAWVEVPIETVQPGDDLLVKPGELFPVDGVIVKGATAADESTLTGESIPVAKALGDSVSGGTLNLDGQAVIQVERLPRESAVQRIIALIQSAQHQKAPAQRFTDTFSRYYTWVVLALSVIVFIWLSAHGHPRREAFYRTMTLLVVASPCALVLSIPSAILVAIASGARLGILFRGGVAVQNLAGVNQFAFDKTGTLTHGNLRVARIEPMQDTTEAAVLRLAASIGQYSTHPVSRAIVAEAESRGIPLETVSDFQNISGLGIQAAVGDTTILVGNRTLLASRAVMLSAREDHEHVEVWVAGTSPLGAIYLSDEVRPESRDTVARLRRFGASVALLTGDRPGVALDVAGPLGITDVRAALTPADKLDAIHAWQAEGRKVAMVGDGINDAPSLTAADVAIGMGSRGSDAALEQADVILMHDRIENVAEAVALSRRARAIIRQNLVVSLGVVLVLVTSALFNKIGLSLGVIGHEGSTVLVVLNGLRLLRTGGRSGEAAISRAGDVATGH